jgi:hypothetical protein
MSFKKNNNGVSQLENHFLKDVSDKGFIQY